MNFPNILTLLRLIIGLVIPFLLVWGYQATWLTLFLFGLLTDFFDGIISRKLKIVTNFGKIMDPIADKVLILGSFIALYLLDAVSLWVITPIFVREVFITILRLKIMLEGKIIAAEWAGKIKTVSQDITILLFFGTVLFRVGESYLVVTMAVTLVCVIMTLYTGIYFIIKNWKAIS